jgi:hypothetical protein
MRGEAALVLMLNLLLETVEQVHDVVTQVLIVIELKRGNS